MIKKKRRTATRVANKVTRVFSNAKDSLKLLETLERETVLKARTLIGLSAGRGARTGHASASASLVSRLRNLGFASQDELAELRLRVETLERTLLNHSIGAAPIPETEAERTLPTP